MPWSQRCEHVRCFVAIGELLERDVRVRRRLVGLDERCLTFTRPYAGGNLRCPPHEHGRIVLNALAMSPRALSGGREPAS